MQHVIVGTAGHIDHGKTALVKALTGIDTDRFIEEKERGITIDIGFANLELESGATIGFVDVPGHERFVKNMLAGVGGIDVVMLVVAADESIMPQTREHMEICSLLNIRYGLTVITKIDTVDEEIADLVELELREYLKPTFLGDSPVVRVSSHTGVGIPELTAALDEVTRRVPAKDTSRIFRLPIDRCFTMKGFGTVVTGTLISGSVRREDEVELLPTGRPCRIRGLQVHGKAVEVAEAGQRTAVNLQGVDVTDAQRGTVLTDRGVLRPASMFDCHLELLRSAAQPILRRKRIRFHVGTSEIMGYVALLGTEQLEPGGDAFAQVRLEEEAVALPGDRFIVRQYSPMVTIGGGEILEVGPRRHRLKDPDVLRRLRAFRDGSTEDRLLILVEEAGLGTKTLSDLVRDVGISAVAIRKHLEGLANRGRVRFLSLEPAVLISESRFQDALVQTLDQILRFHDSQPLATGISKEELRHRVFSQAAGLVFEAVLEELEREGKVEALQDVIRRFGRQVELSPAEAEIRQALKSGFRRLGLKAPAPDEVIQKLGLERSAARKILQLMIRDGGLTKVSEDLVVDPGAMEEMIERIRNRKSTNPKLEVGDFKDLIGVSRKYAIPLLEYLDRRRVTRRVGGARVIL
jgi:selenocysteine-specific elongation factor